VERLTPRVVDELEFGFGWIGGEKPRLQIASHVLAEKGRVWVIDPTDEPSLDDRVRALGEPAGVVQLLDRHNRGAAAVAARLGVPHHRVPVDGIPGSGFEVIPIVLRTYWREIALWWPKRRVLVTGDSLGTVPHYFALGGERLGVHPLLRLTPPRVLARFTPEHVLVGHGEGIHAGAAAAVRDAIAHARRRTLRLPLELPLTLRRSGPAGSGASGEGAARR
jgi:hypothetical protein